MVKLTLNFFFFFSRETIFNSHYITHYFISLKFIWKAPSITLCLLPSKAERVIIIVKPAPDLCIRRRDLYFVGWVLSFKFTECSSLSWVGKSTKNSRVNFILIIFHRPQVTSGLGVMNQVGKKKDTYTRLRDGGKLEHSQCFIIEKFPPLDKFNIQFSSSFIFVWPSLHENFIVFSFFGFYYAVQIVNLRTR